VVDWLSLVAIWSCSGDRLEVAVTTWIHRDAGGTLPEDVIVSLWPDPLEENLEGVLVQRCRILWQG
jgi:hypothetical protein